MEDLPRGVVSTDDSSSDEIITLSGEGPSTPNSLRISIITELRNGAEEKINHFDRLRQRNLLIALAVFAGVFGYAVQAQGWALPTLCGVCIFGLMLLFGL